MPAGTPDNNLSLVVGADSMIGGALWGHLKTCGGDLVGTVLAQPPMPGHLHLDLLDPPERWALPGSVGVAYLCAASTSLDACRQDPAGTARINVSATAEMARQLIGVGAFVVFLSSNAVYDGSIGFRRVADPPCPTTEYGRQKAEAERQLLALGPAAVLRITKVLAPKMGLLAAWQAALNSGRPIRPFADMVMAPVALPLAVQTLSKIGAARRPGIYQLSADRDITYLEAARRVAACLNADPKLLEPMPASSAGLALEAVPVHTTLDMEETRTAFGLVPPSAWEAVDFAMQPSRAAATVNSQGRKPLE
jgi:dTDP-4-dehydrorhamnose reductase